MRGWIVGRHRLPMATALVVAGVATPLVAAEAEADITVVARPHATPDTGLDDPVLRARYDAMWKHYRTDILAAHGQLLADLEARAAKAAAARNTPLGSYWQGLHDNCTRWGFVSWNETRERADWQRFGGAPFPADFAATLQRVRGTCDSAWRGLDKKYELLIQQCKARKSTATAEKLSSERTSLAAWHGAVGPETARSSPVADTPPPQKIPAAPPPAGPKLKRPLKQL